MNALQPSTPLRLLLLAALLATFFLPSAHASISPSLTSLQYDNFTGDIIASDAANANPGFDRDALHARTVWNFSKSAGQAESASCEWRFILLEEATGAAQLIRTASGGSGTVFTVARTVGFNLAIVPQNRSETISADLAPLTRLLPGTRYRLRCQFWRDSGAGMTLQSVHDEEWRRIWHFPELTPATADDFTLAVVSSATLQKNNIIRSQPGQNAFKLDVSFTVRRYDNWLATSPQSTNTFIPVVVSLTNVLTNTDLTLSGNATNQPITIPQFAQSGTLRVPAESTLNVTLDILPSDWTTLNPIPLHTCRISVRHSDDQSLELHDHLAFSRFLAGLTGNIRFGPLLTTFSALQNDFAGTAVAPTEAGFRARGPVTLAAAGGTIPGTPHKFTMNLQELHMAFNGDLHLTQPGALIGVTAPDFPDRQAINNTTLQRGPITLTTNGAQAYGYTLFLPRGMGFSYESTPRRRRLTSKITFAGAVPLTSSLIPVSDPTVGNAGNRIRICLERVPQIFTANSLTFNLGSGRFSFIPVDITYIREKQTSILERLSDIGPASAANPAALRHNSNEEVHRFIDLPALATAAFVESAPDGGASIRSLSLRPTPEGSFFTHFPSRVAIQWNSLALPSPGQFVIASDKVSTASAIEGISPLVIRYGRDCFEAAACDPPIPAAGPGSINCIPASNRLAFTENGGLQAAVTFGSHTLRWGSVNGVLFAQNTGPFTSGSFYMPGNHLPWRSPTGTPDAATAAIAQKNRAATLHFAGFNTATPEVPAPTPTAPATATTPVSTSAFPMAMPPAQAPSQGSPPVPTGSPTPQNTTPASAASAANTNPSRSPSPSASTEWMSPSAISASPTSTTLTPIPPSTAASPSAPTPQPPAPRTSPSTSPVSSSTAAAVSNPPLSVPRPTSLSPTGARSSARSSSNSPNPPTAPTPPKASSNSAARPSSLPSAAPIHGSPARSASAAPTARSSPKPTPMPLAQA